MHMSEILVPNDVKGLTGPNDAKGLTGQVIELQNYILLQLSKVGAGVGGGSVDKEVHRMKVA
jgi:uncharacterized spore protein YtfJ